MDRSSTSPSTGISATPLSRGLSTTSHAASNEDSDSVSSDAQPGRSVRTSAYSRQRRRAVGACTNCKSLKIRCEYIWKESICARCKVAGQTCIIHGRKKRRPAPTHEDLQRRSYAQDAQIQSLLRQLDEAKSLSKIHRLLEQAQAETATIERRRRVLANEHPGQLAMWDNMPVLGDGRYFGRPPRSTESVTPGWYGSLSGDYPEVPASLGRSCGGANLRELFKHGALTPHDVSDLFKFYYENLHSNFPILDPNTQTPQRLLSSSPFLFTVVCAIASRHWTHRPQLHQLIMLFAEEAAAQTLSDCQKDIESCQAYTLLSIYPPPVKRLSDARGWLFIGAAVRMAQDVKLDEPPPVGCEDVEKGARIRTWLHIVCIDASHAIQFGCPPMAPHNSYVSLVPRQWYKSPSANLPYDILLCFYVELFVLAMDFSRIVTQTDLARGLQQAFNVESIVLDYNKRLNDIVTEWWPRLTEDSQCFPVVCVHRRDSADILINALRLVILGYGFHHTAKRGLMPGSDLFKLSVHTARTIIHVHTERSYPSGILRYSSHPEFLHVTFAAAFLVNLLQPRYKSMLDCKLSTALVNDVATLARIYSSREVALGEDHIPAVHAKFLFFLLESLADKYDPPALSRAPIAVSSQPAVAMHAQYSMHLAIEQSSHPGSSSITNHPAIPTANQAGVEFMFNQFMSDVSTFDPRLQDHLPDKRIPDDTWRHFPSSIDQPAFDGMQQVPSSPF